MKKILELLLLACFITPMFAQAPARSTAYSESICSNPNVFFCEDFQDPATAPETTPGSGPDCSGNWKNPGFAFSTYCWNQGGSVANPTIPVPLVPATNNRVYNMQIANATIDGYLKKGGAGKAYTDYYIRWQFYYSSDVQFPIDLDLKQMLTHPEVFADPPSANYQNGIYLAEDFFCSGVGNFGDVPLLRYGGGYGSYPYQNEKCPPLAPGVPANGTNAPRLQKNRWYTVEVHFKLGATSSTGFMEGWLDGNLMYRVNRATCSGSCPPMSYVYFTSYKSPYEPNRSGFVQYDNIVMSTSYIGPPTGGGPPPPPPPPPVAACADGIDNDADGLIDLADPGCLNATDTSEVNAGPPPACSDTLDNDSDGLTDYPADLGCTSGTDTDETNAPPSPPPSGSVVVTFDTPVPSGSPNGYLNGLFQGVNFGTSKWRWEGPYLSGTTHHIYFNSSTENSRTFTFSPGPKKLKTMRVFTGASGTLTLTDNLGQTKVQSITTGRIQMVTTNWANASTTVTVKFNRGWELGVDDIEYVP